VASTAATGERSTSWRRRTAQRTPDILAAARQLFEAQGVAATPVALIARQAQVSEATVFKYFPTKQALIERVVQDWIIPLAQQLEADVRVIHGVRARLALIASRQLTDMLRSPQLYVITYRELRWLNYQGSQLQKLVQRWTRIGIWAIEQGVADGEIRPDIDVTAVRDVFYGGVEQTGLRTALSGRTLDPEIEARKITDTVLGGIAVIKDKVPDPSPASNDRIEVAIAALERIETLLKQS
jgi:TetR/AcrR family transcriptional regulator, fatty acid metabolism regulator protein